MQKGDLDEDPSYDPAHDSGHRHVSESVMRDTVFISHANPEDNRFTLWLALQLVREGYPVWSDLTGLLGGEDIWREAERTIRNRTGKFLYVLSKVSNTKSGPLKELQIAEGVAKRDNRRDFIIPVLIDDLPHADINIQLARLNAISFNDGWRRGLTLLLKKLERDRVPKNRRSSPALVASWWREHFSAKDRILEVAEDYVSNWFPITSVPNVIHLHQANFASLPEAVLDWPAVWHGSYLVSFAPAQDFHQQLGMDAIKGTSGWDTRMFLSEGGRGIPRRQARDIVHQLLRSGWERFVTRRGLPVYQLSGRTICAYFTEETVGTERVVFKGVDGKSNHRQLVGYRTTRLRGDTGEEFARRYWHFAIQAKPIVHPRPAFVIRTHVLFSSDGNRIWTSKERLHRARRMACRDWWNDDWRDRLLAAVTWLAAGNEGVRVQLGSHVAIEVGIEPIRFRSPVSYLEPEEEEPREEADSEDEESEDDGDEVEE